MVRAFRVPVFPTQVGIFRQGHAPPEVPAVTTRCQCRCLARGSQLLFTPENAVQGIGLDLLILSFPLGTDVRDITDNPLVGSDLIEMPLGSGSLYGVFVVVDHLRDFTNGFRVAFVRHLAGVVGGARP